MPKLQIYYSANMSFNANHENKIHAKISEFSVYGSSNMERCSSLCYSEKVGGGI